MRYSPLVDGEHPEYTDVPTDTDDSFEVFISRPRRTVERLLLNIGLANIVLGTLGIGLMCTLVIRYPSQPMAWFAVSAVAIGLILPRVFIDTLVGHTRALSRYWTIGGRVHIGFFVLFMLKVIPSVMWIACLAVTSFAFYWGTLVWVMADSRIISARGEKMLRKKAAARDRLERVVHHASAQRPEGDPDHSVYRSLR